MAFIQEDEDALRVTPLSVDERTWAMALDALFAKMPLRLMLIEVDHSAMLVDRDTWDKHKGSFAATHEARAVFGTCTNATLRLAHMKP